MPKNNHFVSMVLTFVVFTIIGTLSHELGHIAVAKYLGYSTTLHFGSMNYESDFPYSKSHELFILLGGPIQTTITGCIGLFVLYKNRNEWKSINWLAVFLSLFWLRPVFNIVTSISNYLINSTPNPFGGDELKISQLFGLWDGTLSVSFAILGGSILYYLFYKVIPQSIRSTFIISGIIGSIGGYFTWFKFIGPNILP